MGEGTPLRFYHERKYPFLIPNLPIRSDLSVAIMSESRMRVPDKVKEVAKEDFNQARQLASEAVRSAAYLYPFKVRV